MSITDMSCINYILVYVYCMDILKWHRYIMSCVYTSTCILQLGSESPVCPHLSDDLL